MAILPQLHAPPTMVFLLSLIADDSVCVCVCVSLRGKGVERWLCQQRKKK